MTKDEALLMALEAMESVTVECNNFHHPKKDQNHHWAKCPPIVRWDKAITAIKEALAQPEEAQSALSLFQSGFIDGREKGLKEALAQPEQEPLAHSIIAGVLFDFMGWLTSRKERIVLSSADEASPAVEAITEFAKMRNLSLDNAKVQDWNTTPPQRTWVGLTDEEVDECYYWKDRQWTTDELVRHVEAKLKQKNGFAEEKNT